MTKNKFSKKQKAFAFFLSVLTLSFAANYFVSAWTEPSIAPAGCVSGTPGCDAPINVSVTGQYKEGKLQIGGTSSPFNTLEIGDFSSGIPVPGSPLGTLVTTGGAIINTGDEAVSSNPGLLVPYGNIGIGTAIPEFKLSLDNDGGIIAKGTFGSGADLTTSGEGTRLIWYPKKAAFRAGLIKSTVINSDAWDDAKIGTGSFASGMNTTASGSDSMAVGEASTASGIRSVAIGALSQATGDSSVSLGYGSIASNFASVALGFDAVASGDHSVAIGTATASGTASFAKGAGAVASGSESIAIGNNTTATGNNSMSIGTQTASGGMNSTAMGKRISVQGNGSFGIGLYGIGMGVGATITQPNTMAIMGGNVGIGTVTPSEKLEVNGGVRLNTTDAKPACDATKRGTLWFAQGVAGVKDSLEVCAKDAADAYVWRTIY